MKAMDIFLADFSDGPREGRYISAELPNLPFRDQTFNLALCSHFLFLYPDQLSAEFHCRAIEEMLRVAQEARIFSLLTLDRRTSPHLQAVCEHFRSSDRSVEVKAVDYEFQRGGNQMMRIYK